MKKKIFSALIGVVTGLVLSGTALASSVSFFLDTSNAASMFPDGTDYLQVTIDDHGVLNDKIFFTVTPLDPLTSIAGSHFGIDKFAFNGPDLKHSNIALPGWSVSNNKNVSIFGKFDNLLSGGGKSRSNPLTFSISANNDTIDTYAAALSDGSAFFAAHVAGLDIGCSTSQSYHEDGNKTFSRHNSSSREHDGHEGHDGHCGCATSSAYFGGSTSLVPPSSVPVPPAAWLFGSGLLGMVGVARRRHWQ